jgi:NAD(P)-dependent dehydrogenase (short-subunit alcohol dehydrogenase family)
VSTPESGEAIVGTALDAFGTVDVVVNNAGILRDRSFANMTWDEVHAVLDVHLKGAFYVSQPAFRVMKEKNYGRFVFASSNAGILGNFGQANYGAAKMGLVGLSNVIAIEGMKYGIQSNVIAPVARTRMTEDLLGPFADMVDPDQVMPMVVYLCSETNPYTHEVFSAGGGRYARFFVGLNPGWFAGQKVLPSVEEVADHIDTIRDLGDYRVLNSATEELQMLGSILAGGA